MTPEEIELATWLMEMALTFRDLQIAAIDTLIDGLKQHYLFWPNQVRML